MGFCFGVPIVILVLDELVASRDAARDRLRAQRSSIATWSDFAESVKSYVAEERLAQIESIRTEINELRSSLQDLWIGPPYPASHRWHDDELVVLAKPRIHEIETRVNVLLAACSDLLAAEFDTAQWGLISLYWKNIDSDVRRERRAQGLAWIPHPQYLALSSAMERGDPQPVIAGLLKNIQFVQQDCNYALGSTLTFIYGTQGQLFHESMDRHGTTYRLGDESGAILQLRTLLWAAHGMNLSSWSIYPPNAPGDQLRADRMPPRE